jgi:FK506-binding nuclear protein
MAPGASKNAKATLMIRTGENEEPLAVAALREGAAESVALDLVLDQYSEFTVIGNATIHLTGYYMPEYAIDGEDGQDDYDDEELNDDELQQMNDQILGFDEYGVPIIAGEYDSEEDSDFNSEDMDDFSDSEDEFDSAEEDLLDGAIAAAAANARRKSGGISIEDITNDEDNKKGGKKAALALPAPAEFDDDDVSGSDDEEESDDDEEEESESEEEEEEEEPVPAPQPQQKKKAEAAVPKPQQNNKRKAEDEKKPTVAEKKKKEEPKAKKEPASAAVSKKDDKKVVADQVASGNKRVRRYANGFEVEDVQMGSSTGKLAKPGKTVFVRYTGRLKNGDGKIFDKTKGQGTFKFRLGVGEVIKGWDRGVEGMRVGDKRRLTIPPAMGYGSSKTGPIPPNSVLHFDVELVDVK